MDARGPVGLATGLVYLADPLGKSVIDPLTRARLTPAPGIEAAAGDPKDPAHHAYSEGLPMLVDEPELHF
jgi:hypothetical protein